MTLALLQFAFALAVLTYASVLDFKSREVSNWVWAMAYPAGCGLTIATLATEALSIEPVILSLGVSIALSFVLLYFGFYGGADAKALIFVALTIPAYPAGLKPPLGDIALPPVLTMFCNSVFLSMIYPLSVFALNVRDVLKGKKMFEGINVNAREKVLLLFAARKVGLDRIERDLAYFPSETVVTRDGKLKRKLLRFIKAETDLSQYISNLKENQELFKNGVLATPTMPFIIFFTTGLAIAPMGNLVVFTIRFLLKIT